MEMDKIMGKRVNRESSDGLQLNDTDPLGDNK
jgi:hypothetical protein